MPDADNPIWSETAKSFRIGRYQHFKGDEYRVLTLARDSEDRTHELVVYQSLKHPDRVWARSLQMFEEHVDRPELGYVGPRFSYLGPDED